MPALAASLLLMQAAPGPSVAAVSPAMAAYREAKQLQPGRIARTRALDSSSLSKREAMGTFLEGLLDKEVFPKWIPDMYEPIWTVNHPELGYSFRYREDGSTVLEIGMYPTSAAPMNAGTTKQ
jgi:hypothetical protein